MCISTPRRVIPRLDHAVRADVDLLTGPLTRQARPVTTTNDLAASRSRGRTVPSTPPWRKPHARPGDRPVRGRRPRHGSHHSPRPGRRPRGTGFARGVGRARRALRPVGEHLRGSRVALSRLRGVSTYVRRAFGDRAAAAVGWCFFFAVPVGAPPASMMAGRLRRRRRRWWPGHDGRRVALALILGTAAMNAAGLRLSGRVQLGLATVLALLMTARWPSRCHTGARRR